MRASKDLLTLIIALRNQYDNFAKNDEYALEKNRTEPDLLMLDEKQITYHKEQLINNKARARLCNELFTTITDDDAWREEIYNLNHTGVVYEPGCSRRSNWTEAEKELLKIGVLDDEW